MVNEELVLKYISEEKELLSELRLTYTEGQIKMIIEGNLSEEQKEELIKQADRCYIHRLLNSEWDIMPITL